MKRLTTRGALLGAVVIALTAAGIAYATIPDSSGVYTACMLKNIGTIRLIDKSLPSTNLMSHCTDKETEVSWNQKGQDGINGTNGTNGVSVTTAPEPSGANCAAGGVQLTAASGVSYVCNGRDGINGANGTNGTNGVDGTNGVSVTSAVEPAGSNCTNGGSKFTAANGVTYACNGSDGSTGGLAGYEIVTRDTTIQPHAASFVSVVCPAGKKIVSAGWQKISAGGDGTFDVDGGAPSTSFAGGASGWSFSAGNNDGSHPLTLRATGVCVSG